MLLSTPSLPSNQRYIAFRSIDTGVGIPKDKQELVFEAFQQADGTTSRKYGGTGLGLSISTQFAHLLHGAILLESTEGLGSTFTLIIPENADLLIDETSRGESIPPLSQQGRAALLPPDNPPLLFAQGKPPRMNYQLKLVEEPLSSSFKQPIYSYHNERVLIVDDDMRNVYALSHVLKTIGLSVLVANNGQVGIDMLAKNPDICLVLMDIMMPVMNGYEAISHIRQNPVFKELPIIAITAKALEGDKEKCIELGASDFLSKPIDTDKLLLLLQKWIPTHHE